MTKATLVRQSPEYRQILEFYNTRVAQRSQVPLINHIEEGLEILESINASETAMLAFCLHPLVQNSEAVDVSWSSAYSLAAEYRDKANAYLCRLATDWISTPEDVLSVVGSMSSDCKDMLIADKTQNKKDFELYHKGSHPRSVQLDKYFKLWLAFLENERICVG